MGSLTTVSTAFCFFRLHARFCSLVIPGCISLRYDSSNPADKRRPSPASSFFGTACTRQTVHMNRHFFSSLPFPHLFNQAESVEPFFERKPVPLCQRAFLSGKLVSQRRLLNSLGHAVGSDDGADVFAEHFDNLHWSTAHRDNVSRKQAYAQSCQSPVMTF